MASNQGLRLGATLAVDSVQSSRLRQPDDLRPNTDSRAHTALFVKTNAPLFCSSHPFDFIASACNRSSWPALNKMVNSFILCSYRCLWRVTCAVLLVLLVPDA